MRGHPTACTPQLIEQLSTALRDGLRREIAIRMCGISDRTFYNWRERALNGEEPYVHFLQSVYNAEDEFEYNAIKSWLGHKDDIYNTRGELIKKGDWKAIEAYLLHTRNKAYSKKTYINVERELLKEDLSSAEKLNKLSNIIVDQISSGEMSVESGGLMLSAIENRRKLLETVEHEKRIQELEKNNE